MEFLLSIAKPQNYLEEFVMTTYPLLNIFLVPCLDDTLLLVKKETGNALNKRNHYSEQFCDDQL